MVETVFDRGSDVSKEESFDEFADPQLWFIERLLLVGR